MTRYVRLSESLEIVEPLGQPCGAGYVHYLGGRVVAVETVHVALLLAAEGGRGRGGGVWRGRGHDLQTWGESPAAGPGTRVTIQEPKQDYRLASEETERLLESEYITKGVHDHRVTYVKFEKSSLFGAKTSFSFGKT